jgi:hypothetical protein
MTGFSGFGILHHAQLHFPDRAGVALAQQMRSTEGKWLIFAPGAGAVMQLPEFCGFSGASKSTRFEREKPSFAMLWGQHY